MTASVIQRLIQGRVQNDVFVAALEQTRQQHQQKKTQATLIMIELRPSNYHWTGETASAAIDIAAHIQVDLRSTDQVFPCGNGKVAILLPDTHIREAVCLAERLRVRLNDFPHTCGAAADRKWITSIGLAQGLGRESAQDWLSRASDMCSHAGIMGRSWISFDPITAEEQQTAELHTTVKPELQSLYRVGVTSV